MREPTKTAARKGGFLLSADAQTGRFLTVGSVAYVGNKKIQALKLLTNYADEDGLNMQKSAIENDSEDHNTIFYLNKEKATEAGVGDGMKTTVGFPPSGLIHSINDPGSSVKIENKNQTDTIQIYELV